jgi:hypothetical protein
MWKHTSTPGTPDAPKTALHEHDMGLSSDGGMLRRSRLAGHTHGGILTRPLRCMMIQEPMALPVMPYVPGACRY